MTASRSQAYGRLIKTLEEMPATKLHPAELEVLREAADTMLFTSDPSEARRARRNATELADRLVEYGRWNEETSKAILRDLWSCGHLPIVLRAAA
jgi:hypothetical protein